MLSKQGRILIEIRRFNIRPIYFKTGFLGGKMAKEVVILNPDDKGRWFCLDATSLKKLPTKKWCEDLYEGDYSRKYSRTIVILPRTIDPGYTVWKGYIERSRFEPFLELFKEDLIPVEVNPIKKEIVNDTHGGDFKY